MAGADDSALDADGVAQSDIQSGGEHHEARGDYFAVRQRDFLPFSARRNRQGFCDYRFGVRRNLGPDGIDQPVIHDAVLLDGPPVEQVAESCNPVLRVMRRRSKHGFRETGLAKAFELLAAAEFFDAKVGRICRTWIDQDRSHARAPEHGGGR